MFEANIADFRPDFLSPLTTTIIESDSQPYQKLIARGAAPAAVTELLAGVSPQQLLSLPVKNAQDASAMLGGLWLWRDGLDECHGIVQDLIGPTGAFWHAIMHRREGDFANAKYWYARCADHRARRLISAMALDVVGRHTSDKSLLHIVAGEYNPNALVDLVEAIGDQTQDPRYDAAVRIQQIEWEALFYHCAYEATGAEGGMI